MALFSKIKRAFGFGADDIEVDDYDEYPSAEVTPIRSHSDSRSITTHSAEVSDEPVDEVVIDSTPPDEIFQAVVTLFNKQLPPFIQQSVDSEAQRKLIYDSLSQSMKEYIENLQLRALETTERRWKSRREAMNRQIEELKERSHQIEESAADVKQQQLSSERRKRALDARVQELQSKIDSLEAEKEQYELENKSLVNKLRTAAVQDNDLKELTEDNDRLRAEILQLKSGVNPNDTSATDTASEETTALNSRISELEADKKQLLDDVALLKKRCEIADTMINDLNHRASSAQSALNDKNKELTELSAELDRFKETASSATSTQEQALDEVDSLTARVQQLETQLQQAESIAGKAEEEIQSLNSALTESQSDLNEANEELAEARKAIELFNETLSQFEELKENKNRTIAHQKAQIEELNAEINNLRASSQSLDDKNSGLTAEILSLKETIRANLSLQAESEAALRAEIDKLRVNNTYGGRSRRARQSQSSSQPQPSEKPLEETLDNTDWLISSPPPGENSRPSSISDSEFGYQEPKRKDPPGQNSSQMLLW